MTISTLTTDDTNLHNGAMNDPAVPNPEVLERSAGRRQISAQYKAKILAEYDSLSRLEKKGALLRREGLYSSLITTWREQRDKGAAQALARPAGRQTLDPRDREIARLTREVGRLEGELDTSRRVVGIQAKLSALLETLALTSTADSSEKK
jgi:transposase-like protein